ncbi:hypothetical protein FRB99_002236 [Tulasnella sp. 403]|nr:hypothetical protein FRB99_002236 [Tulasnella sp. 403]
MFPSGHCIYVSWYDHEGTIQSNSIDLVEDLSYFLVLLVALQHTPSFGVIEGIASKNEGSPKLLLQLERKEQPPEQLILSEPIRDYYGLQGCATFVYKAAPQDPSTTSLGNKDLVTKITWPDMSRQPEASIISQVVERAEHRKKTSNPGMQHPYPNMEDPNAVLKYLPSIRRWQDFPKYNMQNVRRELGICPGSESESCKCRNQRRILHVTVFNYLEPITALEGLEFLRVFLECFKCHFYLWQLGIQHRDISDSNLMFYRDDSSVAHGVLNDFDLATIDRSPGPCLKRTGTLPFIATDILRSWTEKGSYTHIYLHALESFVWVLIWITASYHEGKCIEPLPYALWLHPLHSSDKRLSLVLHG